MAESAVLGSGFLPRCSERHQSSVSGFTKQAQPSDAPERGMQWIHMFFSSSNDT